MKPEVPVFHIPIGWRRQDGEIVPFENDADLVEGNQQWMDRLMSHPAAIAAGAYVIVGPTQTMFTNLRNRTVIKCRRNHGEWKPSAVADVLED
jgi:hypothetical protein